MKTSSLCIIKKCRFKAERNSLFCDKHQPPPGPFSGFLKLIATSVGTEAAKELIVYLMHHGPHILGLIGKHVGLRESLQQEVSTTHESEMAVHRAIFAIEEGETSNPAITFDLKGFCQTNEDEEGEMMM